MTQELSREPLNEIIPADLDTMTATKQTLEDYTLRFAPRSSPEMVDPGRRHFRAGAFPLNYARYNIDLDLVTRGSGFGCYGSVDSKVIFATFTFALERTREALPLWGGPLRWDYQRW